MAVAESPEWISVEDYLRGEQDGQVRHEYVAGAVYAMTGGSVYHNRIALAFATVLRDKLKGRPCDIFMADMKLQTEHAFYYPDLMVVCDPADREPYTKTRPLMIAEVLSPTTRSIDEREKRVAYQNLDSLQEYLLVERDRAELRLICRADRGGWSERPLRLGDNIHLQSLGLDIAMEYLFEGAWR